MGRFEMETDRKETPDSHELTREALGAFNNVKNIKNPNLEIGDDTDHPGLNIGDDTNDPSLDTQMESNESSLEASNDLGLDAEELEGDTSLLVSNETSELADLESDNLINENMEHDNIDIHDDLEDSYYNSPEDIACDINPPEGPNQQPGETTVDIGAYTLNPGEGPLYYSDKDGVDDTTIDLGIHTLDPDEVVYAGEGEVLPAGYISDSEREEGYFSMDDNDAELAASLGDSGND